MNDWLILCATAAVVQVVFVCLAQQGSVLLAQIGFFFSLAQISAGLAVLLGMAISRRIRQKKRGAVVFSMVLLGLGIWTLATVAAMVSI